MKRILPKPKEVGVAMPRGAVNPELFQKGFDHALAGGKLDKIEYFKASFRLGFREGMLHIREEMKKQGISYMPTKAKFSVG